MTTARQKKKGPRSKTRTPAPAKVRNSKPTLDDESDLLMRSPDFHLELCLNGVKCSLEYLAAFQWMKEHKGPIKHAELNSIRERALSDPTMESRSRVLFLQSLVHYALTEISHSDAATAKKARKFADPALIALSDFVRGERSQDFDRYFARPDKVNRGPVRTELALRTVAYEACRVLIRNSPKGSASRIWKRGAAALAKAGYPHETLSQGYLCDHTPTLNQIRLRDDIDPPTIESAELTLENVSRGIARRAFSRAYKRP